MVLEFAEVLQKKYTKAVAFRLFFDNYFTFLHLLEQLKIMGLKGTDTIRENRVGKECPLSHSLVPKKKERGTLEFVSPNTNSMTLYKLCDNIAIILL